ALVATRVGESHGRRDALTERTGGRLDTSRVPVLGVTGGLRAPLAQLLQIVELEAEPAEVELDVLGERTVASRQNETVAAQPLRVGRIVAHDALIQQIRSRGEAHGSTGMP